MEWRPASYRDFILRGLPVQSTGAEVGVYKGDFSARILKVARPKKLFLVDPWRFFPSNPSKCWGGNSDVDQGVMDGIYAGVVRRFQDAIASGVVQVCRATSLESTATIADGQLDWAYIDGDHRYPAVLQDLEAYWPKIRPGGVLLGDDYDLPNSFFEDGVTKSVAEFTRTHGIPVDLARRHQFRLRKPGPA